MRRLTVGILALAGAAWCWRLTATLWEPGQSGADKANILALPVGILATALSGVSIWLTVKSLRPGPDVGQAARDLSRAVRRERQRFLDQALAVVWNSVPARVRFTDPEPDFLAEPVEKLLLHWQDVDGAEAGSIEDVADFYRSQPNGRLVVLGAPGAGKTVLLSRLVVDLLNDLGELTVGALSPEARIPVLLNLPGCDLRDTWRASGEELANRLQRWITTRLHEDYGLQRTQAEALVNGQHVLPILDGLDEMDPPIEGTTRLERPRALAVLRALNAQTRHAAVLACRQVEYQDLSQSPAVPASRPPVLTDARHVSLRALDATEIVAYLTARFHGRDGQLRPRWQPIANALRTEQTLLNVLANPWQLFLAVTAYTPENSEPKDLLAMTHRQAEAHLLANLIPAVVEYNDTATRNTWTPAQVTRWLGTIAYHQRQVAVDSGTSETDIYLLDLWRVTPSRHPRWVPVVIIAAPFLALLALSIMDILQTGSSPVIAVFIVVGTAFWAWRSWSANSPMKRVDLNVLATAAGRRRLARRLALSLVGGLAVGEGIVTVFGVFDHVIAVEFGLALGLAAGLTGGLSSGVTAVPSVTVLARQYLTYTATVGLTVGLVGGLAAGLIFWRLGGLEEGLYLGVVVGPTMGLAYGLTTGNGTGWLRYAFAVRSAARRGRLPRRPAAFLDWCLEAGLMRIVGNALQFRHRRLQDWLVGSQLSSVEKQPDGGLDDPP